MKADVSPPSGLTFAWPRPERFPLFLFGCVFLSLLAHVATFFVFQVIYPQQVTIPPPAPQISLLSPADPRHQALLRWIDAEDPALVATASSVVPPGLFELPYRPSYAVPRTPLRPAVERTEPVIEPPVRSALALLQSVEARPPVRVALIPPPPTVVSFSAALAARPLREVFAPAWKARAPVSVALEPLQVLLGVNDRGEVRFTFPQSSSGHEPLDLEAVAQLERLHFAPAEAPLTWAFATFTWGADACEPSVSTPP